MSPGSAAHAVVVSRVAPAMSAQVLEPGLCTTPLSQALTETDGWHGVRRVTAYPWPTSMLTLNPLTVEPPR